ncbi:hypothetical protein [Winogradskyella sediminis]|uniref:hypothetical protein n=1 Tax=Winogradskyella sediminis TaxID=1382466 RepID=UPI000E25308F|nr:hypothetical protein [Winogradskyella sediminis]REG86291.1 hypothetical protein C8N41_103389 [Winogradskyella sediminis]
MKTIELITGNDKKRTLVFLDKVNFIRVRSENEVWIYFNNKQPTIAQISFNELVDKIKQL